MNINNTYCISQDIFSQNIDSKRVLLDSNEDIYFSLNDSASLMWDIIADNSSITKVLEILYNTFEVEMNILENDLLTFMKKLEEKELIKIDV